MLQKLLPALSLLVLAVPALAQAPDSAARPALSTRLSALGGSVQTEQRVPLIGATVVVLHLPSGIRRTVATDYQGNFALDGLISGGPYAVQLLLNGYRAQVVNNLFLKSTQPTALTFTLVPDRSGRWYVPR